MAFSIRKIISNISYFSKSEEGSSIENSAQNESSNESHRENYFSSISATDNIEFGRAEADSTTKCAQSLNLPISIKNSAAKKASLSDTDVLSINIDSATAECRKKCKKLKLDIQKASESDTLDVSEDSPINIENTPKHKLLESRNMEMFKNFNFNQSFDISDVSEASDNLDIDLLSEDSDSESANTDEGKIKMCRKVETESATPESFADVQIDRNEEERVAQLLQYQINIEKIEGMLKKLLTEFQFHIEVSKIFNCKSIVTALPGSDITKIPKSLGEVTYIDNKHVPAGWNVIMENEDRTTKNKLKNQLINLRNSVDEFINQYLDEKPKLKYRSSTFDMHKGKRLHKKTRVNKKKKIKHYDFPDLRDAMVNLFSDNSISDDDKCTCCCHESVKSDNESVKSDKDSNHSISSSIGNFTLDSTTLTAYSESLDKIISYNSFQDASLYSTVLQKAATERITFYIQVHSIQINSEPSNDYNSKNLIMFYCPACNVYHNEENGLLKHILSQSHCEKIHFLYKTAYVKKCIASGKEIMPSTVLNSMKMYRDENKIVCFGDAVYACSLCFERDIVGESVLMAHCVDDEHLNRKDMLEEFFN